MRGTSPRVHRPRERQRKIAYDNKRRRINRIASKRLHTGKELKHKYSNRERNKVSLIIHHLTNAISSLGYKHGFEDLNKTGMQKRRRRKWNRELGYTDWKKIVTFTGYKSIAELFDPYHTSKDCSRCGWVNKDLRGEKFECKNCGLIIDRQMNASDENIMNGFTQTGAEWKATDELVRSLYDTMKPQVEVVL